MGESPCVWESTVADPQKFDSKSVTYLITLRTNLPEFSEEGTPVEDGAEGERKITVRRRFGEIQTFRNALDKIAPKGCGLPQLPAKNFFNRFDPKVIEERRKTFEMLLTCIGLNDELRVSETVRSFLSDVPMPEYDKVHAEALEKARAALEAPDSEWKVKLDTCESGGCRVSVRKSDNEASQIVIVKTETKIPRPLDKVYAMYNDLSLWHNWAEATTFRIVEELSEVSHVMNVGYKTPIIDNRDCVYYSARMPGSPTHPSSAGSKSIVAQSVHHPLCPKKNGVVRAWVYLTTTVMTDSGGATDFVSIVHADPKGSVPASIVNQTLGMANKQVTDFAAYAVRNIPAAS